MDPRKTKTLSLILMAVAIISLATNLFLLGQLRQTKRQAAELGKTHERLAHRYLLLEKQRKSQKRSPVDKQESFGQKIIKLQPTKLPGHPKQSSKFAAEWQNPAVDGSERNNQSFREETQDMLADALEEEFPELELNETELAELTDTVIALRESLETLRSLERTGENIEAFENTRERRDQAIMDFERITGMNALDFMMRAPAEGGIDRE